MYKGNSEFRKACDAAIESFRQTHGRGVTLDERAAVRTGIATRMLSEEHPGAVVSPERVREFIGAALSGDRQAVAGYDLVFSPVKSISTLGGRHCGAAGEDRARTFRCVAGDAVLVGEGSHWCRGDQSERAVGLTVKQDALRRCEKRTIASSGSWLRPEDPSPRGCVESADARVRATGPIMSAVGGRRAGGFCVGPVREGRCGSGATPPARRSARCRLRARRPGRRSGSACLGRPSTSQQRQG